MGTRRNEALQAAIQKTAAKSQAARQRKRSKNRKRRPWRVLAEEWFEQIWLVYGKEVKAEPWGEPEKALARKLLKEVDLDKAIKMVQRFVRWWSNQKEGLPNFRYFWKKRETVRGWVEGTVKTSKERRDREREHDPSTADDYPDIGWG